MSEPQTPAEPALAGRRLRLRPLAEGDARAVLDAVNASRAELRRRFGWVESVAGPEDVSRYIAAKEAAWRAGEAATFGIFDSRLARLLGVLAVDPIVRSRLRGELSLWIRDGEQDKGFAVEAGRLAADYAFRKLVLHRLSTRIDPANRAARKVLQRLGFHYEGCLRQDKRLNGRWIDQECWGALRSEWKPQPGPRPRRAAR